MFKLFFDAAAVAMGLVIGLHIGDVFGRKAAKGVEAGCDVVGGWFGREPSVVSEKETTRQRLLDAMDKVPPPSVPVSVVANGA